jgi:hypothetical protein
MTASVLLWGLVAIVSGVFFSVYGYSLFRMVLLAIGFLLGFSIGMNLAASQPDLLRFVISLVLGGLLGFLLYALFSLSLYVAGAVFGLIVGLLIASILGLSSDGVLSTIVVIAGVAVGGFFGRFLKELIIILATSAAGAYAIVYGLALMFPGAFGAEPGASGGTLLPMSLLTLLMIAALGMVSGLAQYQILQLRQRAVRR